MSAASLSGEHNAQSDRPAISSSGSPVIVAMYCIVDATSITKAEITYATEKNHTIHGHR